MLSPRSLGGRARVSCTSACAIIQSLDLNKYCKPSCAAVRSSCQLESNTQEAAMSGKSLVKCRAPKSGGGCVGGDLPLRNARFVKAIRSSTAASEDDIANTWPIEVRMCLAGMATFADADRKDRQSV